MLENYNSNSGSFYMQTPYTSLHGFMTLLHITITAQGTTVKEKTIWINLFYLFFYCSHSSGFGTLSAILEIMLNVDKR